MRWTGWSEGLLQPRCIEAGWANAYDGRMFGRLSFRDFCIAIAILVFTLPITCIVSEFITHTQLGATIAVALAIVAGFLFVAFIDWVIWKDDWKERRKLNDALRKWQTLTGEAQAPASQRRSARWWWRPIRNWWLRKRDRDM